MSDSAPDWNGLARTADAIVGTPCYILSEQAVLNSLRALNAFESTVKLRHWVSLKTQPVARLVRAASGWGLGVDIVSEYELAGALGSGLSGSQILVNGVGKHVWMKRCRTPGLRVHFDSIAEVCELANAAKNLHWAVGLRCAVPVSAAVDRGDAWDQFGMTPDEVRSASAILNDVGVAVRGLHFHLHTGIRRVAEYRRALEYVAQVSDAAHLQPEYIDIGGGLPIEGETALDGTSAAATFELGEFRSLMGIVPSILPSVGEVWLENGRFLTGPAGALVMTVLDKKERADRTFLICDGGRVNHARNASIEIHRILVQPARSGPLRMTTVCGPTCGSIDRLGSWMLPESISPGDHVIWLTAGAYHIPLETRFSFGKAPVVWFDERNEPEVVRERETPAQWWGQWTSRGLGPSASSNASSSIVVSRKR